MSALLYALGLVLVLEGLLPLMAPRVWRDVFKRMNAQTDGQLRFIGLIFVVVGTALLAAMAE